MEEAEYYIPVHEWEPVSALPERWGRWWQEGWKFAKRLDLRNTTSLERACEPVEVEVEFHAGQVSDLSREIRVAALESEDGPLREIPSQVHGDLLEGDLRRTRLFFVASLKPQEKKTYLVFYGHPTAAMPAYQTDLQVSGKDYALDLENRYYRVELARSMGHLKSLAFKEGAAFLGKGTGLPYRGHGVEGSIHHNPDWSDEHTGRYRVTSWTSPPHWEVVRGPVCVRTRRWGHPILALGPGVGRAHKVRASITYTFYASVPYIVVESRLDVLEDVRFSDCRNDEWVGIGRDLPDMAWGLKSGEIGFGAKSWSREDPAWLTFFNRATGAGFASIRLAYECTHPDWHAPSDVAINDQWGGLWVRYPLRHALMREGDFVREKNAYLLHRYEPPRESGFGMLVDYAHLLSHPPAQEPVPMGARPLTVAGVWDVLRTCYDTEVYIKGSPFSKRRLSYVDLGWVRRVRIDGSAVHIAMVLPYEGRQASFGWFAEHIEEQIRHLVDGVGEVRVELLREPPWAVEQMTARGRRAMGL